jgi:hypothetical protein
MLHLCSGDESIDHIFFQWIVAKQIWQVISSLFFVPLGDDYLSIAKFWVAKTKHANLNSSCDVMASYACACTMYCGWSSIPSRDDVNLRGPHDDVRTPLLWPCVAEPGEELRANEWLLDSVGFICLLITRIHQRKEWSHFLADRQEGHHAGYLVDSSLGAASMVSPV